MYIFKEYSNGIEVSNSYKTLFDKKTINTIYKKYKWQRSKFSLYVEWTFHTICYKLGIEKESAKDVFFEFDKSWFKAIIKRIKQKIIKK